MTATPKPFNKLFFSEALEYFASYKGKTTSAQHIKPFHWAIACRLVIEGGFDPEWITPHPPFIAKPSRKRGASWKLEFDSNAATGVERTILGGLKTKNVDVVVTSPELGPILAVSCKGVTKAFRNLTNRLEETIGECTNLHITYPALVMGYYALIRGNRTQAQADAAPSDPDAVHDREAGDDFSLEASEEPKKSKKENRNDLAFTGDGDCEVSDNIVRFHDALSRMTNRKDLRDEISRYEAMAMTIVEVEAPAGRIYPAFPTPESALNSKHFFHTLYKRYDERFVLAAASIPHLKRKCWEPSDVIDMFEKDARFWGEYLPRVTS